MGMYHIEIRMFMKVFITKNVIDIHIGQTVSPVKLPQFQ